MTMIRRGSILLAAVLVGCGGGGSGSYGTTAPPPSTPGTTTTGSEPVSNASISVSATGDGYGATTYTFDPAGVTLKRGGTVTWSNSTGVTHNVVFTSAPGVPANVADFGSGSQSRTFDTAGTYEFQCTHHSSMSGTIVVQ
jgi:plastocyanin